MTNHSITHREYEILEKVTQGYSSKEISDILYISTHTVLSHRKNLLEKLNARNTCHMVAKAFEMKILKTVTVAN